jgi:hypothetical protein
VLFKISVAIAFIIAAFAVVVSVQPGNFHISRTTTIAAPVTTLFTQIATLRNWNNWSPWAKLDPHATITFSGPASGVGSSMHWSGNKEIGEGTMTVVMIEPDRSITLKLDFERPMKGTRMSTFTFNPVGGITEVTWQMDGTNNFVAKAMSLFMNCDKIIGAQFEQGFTNLQRIVARREPAA